MGSANTGLTVGYRLDKNGAGFANSNTGILVLTELANGWYFFDLDATDTNTIGVISHELTGVTLTDGGERQDQIVAMHNDWPKSWVVGFDDNTIGTTTLADGLLTAAKIAASAIGPTTISDAAKLALFTVPVLPEAYPALGANPTPATALLAILQLLSEVSIVGTTLSIKSLNASGTVMTYTLNNAANPTSRTRAT